MCRLTVVQLSGECCDSTSCFEIIDKGIVHYNIYIGSYDITAPPKHAISRFCEIVDSAAGCVAVYCEAARGLGCTEFFIAHYLARSHGFAIRESVGLLQLIMPECAVADQQECFLDMHGRHTPCSTMI